MFKFFTWEITRLIQFNDCLFIDPRISWDSLYYLMILHSHSRGGLLMSADR